MCVCVRVCVRARARLLVCVCERGREKESEGEIDGGDWEGKSERVGNYKVYLLYNYKEKILGEYLYLQSVIANLHTTPPPPPSTSPKRKNKEHVQITAA